MGDLRNLFWQRLNAEIMAVNSHSTDSGALHADETPAEHLSVAIVDDHPPIREAIRHEVGQAIGMTVAFEAGTPEDAACLIEECAPDVAILDICFGEGQGFGLIQLLQAECPGVSILVFSNYEEAVYAEPVLREGASGYLMKDAPMQELQGAVRRVAEGEVYLSPEMTVRVLQQMQGGEAEVCFPIDELTSRELRVFRMLGKGMSVVEIADQLDLARKTVETHRRRAKEKLGYERIDDLVSHAARWVQVDKHTKAA